MSPSFPYEFARRWFAAGLVLGALNACSEIASAEDWMFRRSYFSHDLPEGVAANYPVPTSRSAYRIAQYRDGFGINSAYRVNNYVIVNGDRVDRTYYREGWIEFVRPGQ
jgi:hypothetical protein